ncbi:Mitogen-activated protein kinase-binding protein 1 [Linum perenne]
MKANRRAKKPDASSKLVLEEIIGLTTKNANGLASTESTSSCAYIAGCAVVLHDVDSGQQSHLIASHRTPKPLSCVAMSRDGRLVAAGESGNQPAVLVWDRSTMSFLSDLNGHVYGVECIAFSPDGEHLVSVGGYIYLWDWKNGVLVAKLKASSSCSAITSVSFSSNGKSIITAGKKHLKFWTVGLTPKNTRLNAATGAMIIQGKPVNLGPHKGSSFVCVASSANIEPTALLALEEFCIILNVLLMFAGVLCVIDKGLSVAKSADLKVEKGLALSASRKLIACGCCNGIVKLFGSETLNYAGTLLHSKAKICDEPIDNLSHTEVSGENPLPTLPDSVACQFSASDKLVVVYADHTLYIWDVLDVNQATRCCMLVSHSACIWDVKNLCCEYMHDPSIVCAARGCAGGVSFATCSADGTIRLWDLAPQQQFVGDDSEHHGLNAEPLSTSCLASTGIFERETLDVGLSSHGFRCMAISSDGQYLASGDNEGNLHIYNLRTFDYTCFQDVHHSEILSLSFSASQEEHNAPEVNHGNYLLVSGGRDRVIHLYDVKRNFNLIASVDEHSAAVTSVKLDREGCKAISCSADRSLVFRDVFVSDSGCQIFRRHHQMASLGTVYDMAVDKKMEFVVTVGQDKKINTFDVASGKMVRSFKQDKDFGDPIKVIMDPSCSYLLCSYSNKSICMYDSMSGEMVMQAMGHGEVVTGLVFLPDCKHIVSVAGDGCIFVWKLPPRITCRILQRIKENFVPLSPEELGLPVTFARLVIADEENLQFRVNPQDAQEVRYEGVAPERTPTFRFSISRLPKWAQSKLADSDAQMNPDCSPAKEQHVELKIVSPLTCNSRESDYVDIEVKTPSNLDTCGKESCFNNSASELALTSERDSKHMTRKNLSHFALDKRWLSVYTVCHILNSPEVQRSMDLKMPVPSLASTSETDEVPISCEDHREAAASELSSSSGSCDILSPNNGQTSGEITNASNQPNGSQMPEQSLFRSETQAQEGIATEESELFKQHFGSLSAASKIEGCKSSVRRSYSTMWCGVTILVFPRNSLTHPSEILVVKLQRLLK